jgi:hypothetical protein
MPADLPGGFKNTFGFTEEKEKPVEDAGHASGGKK